MDWVTVRNTLLSTIKSCVRVNTYWRDRERPFVDPVDNSGVPAEAGVTCLLHMMSPIAIGDDDFRYDYNPTTELIDITQSGLRQFTLTVLVESYDQADNKQALVYIERVRNCLARPQVKDLLRAANLVVYDVLAAVDLTEFRDDHAVSICSMDVLFHFVINETSEDGGPGLDPLNWIEHVYGNHANENGPGNPDATNPNDPNWIPPKYDGEG